MKPIKVRILHTLLFEITAVTLSTFMASIIYKKETSTMLLMTVILSTVAMIINYLFNFFFDALLHKYQWQRTLRIRIVHTLLFQVILLSAIIPIISLFVEKSLLETFFLNLFFVFFFIPFTFLFNLTFDYCYYRLKLRHTPIALHDNNK